ncbi:maleylpyruvate isomerase family mycothiol-dependent enzyme [Streptomyces sp. NPDC006879]|uniref:maleylpyruvate isomerase family mycothiol-dependent enzyme n=1 Tax=Streptomyces sp. NPDC006879 TaxID=3364767 RepID=UPI003695B8F4
MTKGELQQPSAPITIDSYLRSLEREGQALAETAAKAGTGAFVPTCPGWQVSQLLRHTGVVHQWAAGILRSGAPGYQPMGPEPTTDGEALVEWYRTAHRQLLDALRAAPQDLECWTFLPAASPLAFWARRQAHETTVHRLDAEAALGIEYTDCAAAFAEDGLDELTAGFHGLDRSKVRTPGPRVLQLHATDTGSRWTMTLSEEKPPQTVRGETAPAECQLAAPAATLYAALWNRRPLTALTITGDIRLAELWRDTSPIG